MEELERNLSSPRSRNLVFTSAGDRSCVSKWLRGPRDFDLFVTYYGEQPRRFADRADYWNERKGSKFQNLLHAYRTWGELIASYDAVLVLDDDVRIGARGISRLFEIRSERDLWVLQPAFSPLGKFSWPITRARPSSLLRFTSYVDVTCPLFRRDKLDQFMKVYDPVLAGYGIDWWFLEVLGPALEGKVAVVDEVPCVNPFHVFKGRGAREIDRLEPARARVAAWKEIKARYGITSDDRGCVEYSSVDRPWTGKWPSPTWWARVLGYSVLLGVRRVFRGIARWHWRRTLR